MRFNVNDHVRVRLTEHGREAMRERTDEVNAWIRQRNPHAKLLPYDTIADLWRKRQNQLGVAVAIRCTRPPETGG